MSLQKYDPKAPGFEGDDNIYGIGIRIGYYTQALSIWCANHYAQHEAPYLHTITLWFLVALFIGLCVLCKDPTEVHAVEPFMLVTVAYYTLYMGLWDSSPPFLLPWELIFRKNVVVDLAWLAFHGFDVWYWWWGVYQMQPSNGPLGTLIFFPYIGTARLLPSEGAWIHIVAKVLNMILMVYLLVDITCLICYTFMQRRMDELVRVERLKGLTERWLAMYGGPVASSKDHDKDEDVYPSSSGENFLLRTPPAPSREHSKSSFKSTESERRGTTSPDMNCTSESKKKDENDEEGNQVLNKLLRRQTTDLPAYRQQTRTSTTGLKKAVLGWTNTGKTFDLSAPPPEYHAYEPTFPALEVAAKLLRDTNHSKEAKNKDGTKKKWSWKQCLLGFAFIELWVINFFWCFFLFFKNPIRPAVLFAVVSHAYTMKASRKLSYPHVVRRAIQHPNYRSTTSKDLTLASRILLTTEPPKPLGRKTRHFIAISTLIMCAVLVFSTELTIIWNGVKGVQELASVGQLIPFTLGVGGLLKVVWAALFERHRRDADRTCYFGRCASPPKKREWDEVGEKIKQVREAYERTQGIQAEPRGKGKESA